MSNFSFNLPNILNKLLKVVKKNQEPFNFRDLSE